MASKSKASFGGNWTREKLEILRNYLNAYTTALKNKPFELLYIDAFAGTGMVELKNQDPDQIEFIDGSARIALDINDKHFDELIFIEQDEERCSKLKKLCTEKPGRRITVKRADANESLQTLRRDWRNSRGVLFLDPFGAQVDWSTLKIIAEYKALDTWILFSCIHDCPNAAHE